MRQCVDGETGVPPVQAARRAAEERALCADFPPEET